MEEEIYEIPSKEEYDKQNQTNSIPVEDEDYIVKIAKIDYRLRPGFIKGKLNYTDMQPTFTMICLPIALKGGGQMRDIQGNSVKPLTKWIWRDINPRSIGWQPDKITPSFMRALIAYMEGVDPKDKIQAPGFILLDNNLNEVQDKSKRKEFLQELKNQREEGIRGKLMKEGYLIIPDIRSYEGRYIGCCVEVMQKGSNKITKFSKLPQNFTEPDKDFEKLALEKFKENYKKMLERRKQREAEDKSELYTIQENNEIELEDIPF